jgi:hypothetical protein
MLTFLSSITPLSYTLVPLSKVYERLAAAAKPLQINWSCNASVSTSLMQPVNSFKLPFLPLQKPSGIN